MEINCLREINLPRSIFDWVFSCKGILSEGSRRNSLGSTIAELLNDNFDSEDSELKNLDWEEWETEDEQQPPSSLPSSYFETAKYQNDYFENAKHHQSEAESYHTDTDDASIVVDILDMAQPVVSLLGDRQVCPSTTDSETSYQIDLAPSFGARQDTLSVTSCQTTSYQTDESSEPTYEELESIKVDMRNRDLCSIYIYWSAINSYNFSLHTIFKTFIIFLRTLTFVLIDGSHFYILNMIVFKGLAKLQ